MATTTAKRPSPKAAAKITTETGTMGRMVLVNGGKTILDRGVPCSETMKLVKSLPTLMKSWKPGRFKLTIEGEVTKGAAKKAPARKATPMH